MAAIFALIASLRQAKTCEFRAYIFTAIFARKRIMDVIDGKWIAARLSANHGARKALADAIGLTPDKITKIIKGERAVKAHEIPLIVAYFTTDDTPELGFAEPSAIYAATPIALMAPAGQTMLRTANLVAPQVKAPVIFVMQRSAFAAGLLTGDTLITELGNTATVGDLVLVTINDTDIDAQTTVLRRFLPPILAALDMDEAPISIPAAPSLESAILATVKAVMRAKVAETPN